MVTTVLGILLAVSIINWVLVESEAKALRHDVKELNKIIDHHWDILGDVLEK